MLNSEPYEGGWMVKMVLDDPSELDEMLEAEEYEAYNEEREG